MQLLDEEVARREEQKASLLEQREERWEKEKQLRKLYEEIDQLAKEAKTTRPPQLQLSIHQGMKSLALQSQQGSAYGRLSPILIQHSSPEEGEYRSSPPGKRQKLSATSLPQGMSKAQHSGGLFWTNAQPRSEFQFRSTPQFSFTDQRLSIGWPADLSGPTQAPHVGTMWGTAPSYKAIYAPSRVQDASRALVPHGNVGQAGDFMRTNPVNNAPSWPKLMPCPFWSYIRNCNQSRCHKSHDPLDFVRAENALLSRFSNWQLDQQSTAVPANLLTTTAWIPCEEFLRGNCNRHCGYSHNPADARAMYRMARQTHQTKFDRLIHKRREDLESIGFLKRPRA